MRTDRCEQKDVAAAQPDRVKAMAAQWKADDDLYIKQREGAPATSKQMMKGAEAAQLQSSQPTISS